MELADRLEEDTLSHPVAVPSPSLRLLLLTPPSRDGFDKDVHSLRNGGGQIQLFVLEPCNNTPEVPTVWGEILFNPTIITKSCRYRTHWWTLDQPSSIRVWATGMTQRQLRSQPRSDDGPPPYGTPSKKFFFNLLDLNITEYPGRTLHTRGRFPGSRS